MDNEAFTAARKGNLSKLNELLNRGLDVNAKDAKQQTLLHHAAKNGQREVVKCLLQNGADVLITDRNDYTALHMAVTKGGEIVTNVFLANVARDKLRKLLDMRTRDEGMAALHFAVKQVQHISYLFLLEYGANFEIRNNAGEKPIDLAILDEFRQLLQLIDSSFVKAKKGDMTLVDELDAVPALAFTPVINCRNNDGHTLIQVAVINKRYKLANELLWSRANQISGFQAKSFYDENRKGDIDEIAKRVEEFEEFWGKPRQRDMKLGALSKGQRSKSLGRHFVKLCCRALQKSHEVLLAYRRVGGKDEPITASAAMKTLEETLEVLGFDPEQLFEIAGKKDSYYEKLSVKLKKSVYLHAALVTNVIDASIQHFLPWINAIRLFYAVKDDDMVKVQQLADNELTVNSVHHGRTPLGHAVEKGNKKMTKLLLKSGAEVIQDYAVSPVCLAVKQGHAKIVKLILKNVDAKDLIEIVDHREQFDYTALHVAARKGRLDIVKILMRYGATYSVFDAEGRAPLHVTTDEGVKDFLKLVDSCFHDAKEANTDLVYKLKAMEFDEFMAVAGTRNREGHTLADAAAEANAKSIAAFILRMVKEATEQNEK